MTNHIQTASGDEEPNRFNLSKFRIPQEFDTGATEKVIVPKAMRPPKGEFVRTHPSEDYWLKLGVVEKGGIKELYLVSGNLQEHLRNDDTFSFRLFATAMTRNGDIFLWPIKLTENDWSRSDAAAAEYARKGWVRVLSNTGIGRYEVHKAHAEGVDPAWPDVPFPELLEKAFEGRIIDSWDHPVLRELRGEV